LLILLLAFGFLSFIFVLIFIFGFLLPIFYWGVVSFLLPVLISRVEPRLFPILIWGIDPCLLSIVVSGVVLCLRCLWSRRLCILCFRLLLKVVIFYRILWCLAGVSRLHVVGVVVEVATLAWPCVGVACMPRLCLRGAWR